MKQVITAAAGIAVGALLAGAAFKYLGARPGPAGDGASLSPAGESGAAAAPAEKIMYNCAMHPSYISDKPGNCPICGMKLVRMGKESPAANGADSMTAAGVRIDAATARNMGVRTEPVARRDLASEVRASARLRVDEGRVAVVNSRVAGYAEKLFADVTGQAVSKGGPLLELYSPDLAAAQEEYLQAVRYARGAGAAEGTGAGELVESAKRRLGNWGVPAEALRALEGGGPVPRTLAIPSPVTGVVLEKHIVKGQSVSPGMPLYTLADLSRVWAVANVYQSDLAMVRLGGEAEVELNHLPGKPFRGRIVFVSPVLDSGSRTAEVRVEVANTAALDLKPEMFGTVILKGPARKAVLAVPEQAIIRSGRRNLAIVAAGNGVFEPREVMLGAGSGGYVEVTQGLSEGDALVVSSQFLIDSESNLKAAVRRLQAADGK